MIGRLWVVARTGHGCRLITSGKDLPRWSDAKSRTGGRSPFLQGLIPLDIQPRLASSLTEFHPIGRLLPTGHTPVNGCSDWRSPCGATWQIIWHALTDEMRRDERRPGGVTSAACLLVLLTTRSGSIYLVLQTPTSLLLLHHYDYHYLQYQLLTHPAI